MRPELILAGILISSFKSLCDASKKSGGKRGVSLGGANSSNSNLSSNSPAKNSSTLSPMKPSSSSSSASTPVKSAKIDPSALKEISGMNMACLISPMRILDKETKHLCPDFDILAKDEDLPSRIFLPSSSYIYDPESWSLPLQQLSKPLDLLNLDYKLKIIRDNLDDEGVEQYCASSIHLSHYIISASVSFVQLNYLLSRFRNTVDNSEVVINRVYRMILDHMTALSRFCQRISACGNDFGLAIPISSLFVPESYYRNFLEIILRPHLHFAEDQIEKINEFFFNAYGNDFFTTLTQVLFEKISAGSWAPLPINFLRRKMVFTNRGEVEKFIQNWKEKVFSGNNGWNDRHLVDLGVFLQQGMIDYDSLVQIHHQMAVNGIKSLFKFNSFIVELISYAISAPFLLPSDPAVALLIGNYAPKNHQAQDLPEARKFDIIVEIFEFYLKDLEPAYVEDELYSKFCQLIQKLDFVYPEIFLRIWQVVPTLLDVEKARMNGIDYSAGLSSLFEKYNTECSENSAKLALIREYFNHEQVFGNYFLNSEGLFKVFEFFAEVFSDVIDQIENLNDAQPVDNDLKGIVEECFMFFDEFLDKFAHKSILNHWYEALDFIPTSVYANLTKLWHMNAYNSKLVDRKEFIIGNIFKLVDHNLYYAEKFLMANKAMILRFGEIPFFERLPTPSCIVESGKASEYNSEILEALFDYLSANNIEIVPDYLFSTISTLFSLKELSIEATKSFLSRALSPDFRVDISQIGYSELFNPPFIIEILDIFTDSEPEIIDFCQSVLKNYLIAINSRIKDEIFITAAFLRNVSFFISLFPFLSVTINPASSALNVERFYGLMEFVSFDDLEMSTLTTLSLLVEIARSEITLAQANKIVAILLDMMKKAVDLDKVKLKNFDTWTLTVQALFIYITRNPAIQLPGNEEKTMTIVYNFYSVFARTLPNGYDNIFRLIKKSSTLEALCRNMIEQNEFLPKIIFELPVTLEAKAANKIQLNYADMISKMTFDFVEHEYFNAFIHWIATGKANFDAVMRLLNIIKPQTHFNVVFICFRVIETLLACPLYSGAQKQEALRKIFNDTNANFIIDLLSCKNAFEIDYIMTALSSESNYPHITHVIEGFKTTSWYPALRAEVERAKILNSEENSIKNLANLDFIADGLFKKTIIDFKSYIPNYFLKRVTFYGIKSLIETVSFGPSLLLKGRMNEPLKKFLMNVGTFFYQSDRSTDKIFRIHPDEDVFIFVMKFQSQVFNQEISRDLFLFNMFKSLRKFIARSKILESYQQFMTRDNFGLSEIAVTSMQEWFKKNETHLIVEFLESITVFLFAKILPVALDKSCKKISALDEMLKMYANLMSKSNIPLISSDSKLHKVVLHGLADLKMIRNDLLENSASLIDYLVVVVKLFSKNVEIMNLIGTLIIDLSRLFSINKAKWNIIWTVLQHNLPVSLAYEPRAKFFIDLAGGKFDNWNNFVTGPENMNLTDEIRVKYVVGAIETRHDVQEKILGLLPKTIKYEYFESFDELEVLIDFVNDFIDNLNRIGGDIGSEIFIRLLSWLEMELKTCSYSPLNMRKIIEYSQFYAEYAQAIVTFIQRNINHLLTVIQSDDYILALIYQLHNFDSAIPTERDFVLAKLIDEYQKRISPSDSSNLYDEYLRSAGPIAESKNQIRLSFEKIDEVQESVCGAFTEMLKNPNGFAVLAGLLEIIKLFDNRALSDMERTETRSFIVDSIIITLAKIIESRGIMTLVLLIDDIIIETIIQIFSYHVDQSIEGFNYILEKLMKFNSSHVAHLFYQQIADGTLRGDVCFLSRDIIGRFEVVKEGFTAEERSSWASLYLKNLINAPPDVVVDPQYFERFLDLLDEVKVEDIDLNVIFKDLQIILSNTSCIVPILDFLDQLNANLGKSLNLDNKIILNKFLTSEALNAILLEGLPEAVLKRSVAFINNIKKVESDYYASWYVMKSSRPEIARLLDERLKSVEQKTKVSIHNSVARRMIEKVSATDFSNLEGFEGVIENLKKLDYSAIDAEIISSIVSALIEACERAPQDQQFKPSLKSAVMLLIPISSIESFSIILKLSERVFDDEVLLALVSRAENGEMVKEIIFALRSFININHVTHIKACLVKNSLEKDMEILELAAKNSNPTQLIKYFQSVKNCALSFKLNLLTVSEVVSGNDKILDLLSYFRNMLSTNSAESLDIVKAALNNRTLMSCFTSSVKANSKNRSAIIAFLKTQITFRSAKKIISEIELVVSKLLLKLLFAPSSTEGQLIPIEADFNSLDWPAFFSVNLADILEINRNSDKTASFLKAFRLYEEIDSRFGCLNEPELISLMDNFSEHLTANPHPWSSGPAVYAVTKLCRRIVFMKHQRYNILGKLLFNRKYLRNDLLEAFLMAQIDSGNIDWELHEKIVNAVKSESSSHRRYLLDRFKEENK